MNDLILVSWQMSVAKIAFVRKN